MGLSDALDVLNTHHIHFLQDNVMHQSQRTQLRKIQERGHKY